MPIAPSHIGMDRHMAMGTDALHFPLFGQWSPAKPETYVNVTAAP
jgi:hypothetical protein